LLQLAISNGFLFQQKRKLDFTFHAKLLREFHFFARKNFLSEMVDSIINKQRGF